MKTLILILLTTLLLAGCDNSNPVNTSPVETQIYKSEQVYSVNAIQGQSENYKDYNLGILNFSNSDSLIISFEYLMISNGGLAGSGVNLIQTPNNFFNSGSLLDTEYKYKEFTQRFARNELINSSDSVKLRLVVQYNALSLAVRNIVISKK